MSQPSKTKAEKPRCGLCGKTRNLMKTSCCGNWICDDHHKYVLFSYARNSCARNHDRYTLCAFHHHNGHKGHWKGCKLCRKSFQTGMYVWYGTNAYNFEELENPPHYEPTRCDRCGVVIKLGTDGHSVGPRGTLCERCTDLDRVYDLPPKARKPSAPCKPKPQLPANANPGAIEIILSARVQKRWQVKPVVRASEPPAHWLAQWRMDFAQKADRTWVVLATNVVTLYTFVLPLNDLGTRDNFEPVSELRSRRRESAQTEGNGADSRPRLQGFERASFEKLFRMRLGFALTDAPALAMWKNAPLLFATGNPRMAVGSMNDMRKHLAWRTETEIGPMKDDEDWINKTPFLSLPTKFPEREFAQRLAEK